MAPRRVAINGMGRIGRLTLRVAWMMPDSYTFVHFNDVASAESIAYLLKYDSIHGTWGPSVKVEGSDILITDGTRSVRVAVTQQSKPSEIDYTACQPEVVLECTGAHLTRAELQPYFDKGVKKVVVSAPVKDPEPVLNIVVGCNETLYDASKDHIVTAASCTTNCLAPVIKVIHETYGIIKGAITTIHCVTNTQTIIDAPNHKKSDLRRARSGLMNLAPTSTGSATAIALIFPELKGKLNGHAVRVPLTNSSITDVVLSLAQNTTAEEVNRVLTKASETYLKGILQVEYNALVSTDFVNNPHSSIVDAPSTMVIDGNMLKIYAWYDNEWGYSSRMAEIGKLVIERLD